MIHHGQSKVLVGWQDLNPQQRRYQRPGLSYEVTDLIKQAVPASDLNPRLSYLN